LKLSPLLSEFLLANKELDLGGIGRFTIDNAGSINFEQNGSIRENPVLVSYIAEKSGKMKSLIASDLDSHLELARQFLNIGKPYQFEGIGTLTKNKFGQLEFVQSNAVSEKKENIGDGRDTTSTTENSFTDYEEMFSPKKPRTNAAKSIITWLIIIAGLSLAVFGGYLVYSKTKNKTKEPVANKTEPVITPQQQEQKTSLRDSRGTAKKDSVGLVQPEKQISGLNNYRFVVEQASKARAFYRYALLKKSFIDVHMDTKDSVLFKLYFLLPSLPADTARKRDSLQRLYSTRGKAFVELN
jgi:hypothetical protein